MTEQDSVIERAAPEPVAPPQTIIHYCVATGYIRSWGNLEPIGDVSPHPDHALLRIVCDRDIDPVRDMVDLARLAVVERPAAAQRALLLEQLSLSVRLAVGAELAATDQFMVPDRVVADRNAWMSYRQQLRDLSKLPDAATMVRCWPARPDAGDVCEDLRGQLARIASLPASAR
ncbi:hypothetical protein ACVILK_000494 [Bradyrhizobium embrapense]